MCYGDERPARALFYLLDTERVYIAYIGEYYEKSRAKILLLFYYLNMKVKTFIQFHVALNTYE